MITYSIIKKSQLKESQRIDAEYFQPEYLHIEKQLASTRTTKINEITKSVVNFGAYSLCNFIVWQETGIPYLNVENIKDGYIDFEDVKFIDDEVNEILKKSKVKEGQVILTMAGTIGNAAVAHKIPPKINSNQATAKITLREGFSPYFLAAFLNSYYGKKQTEREIVSSVQPNIFLWQIKKFSVPIVSKDKEKEIEKIYKDGLNTLELSKLLYDQAGDLLLDELGLKDFKIEDGLAYTVNLSDIKSAHRADADYFQPKYENLIKSLKKAHQPLRTLVIKRKGKKSKIILADDYKYIEIRDIDIGSGEVSHTIRKGYDLPANAKIKIEGGELIVSKVRPTRGAVGIIPEGWSDNFVASGAFSVFEVLPPTREYLQVVLRSFIGKLQLEKPTTGSSYPTVNDEDVENLIIPNLPLFTQQKIADLVCQSHEARKKAKELLEKAKREVEDLISRVK